MIDGGEKSREKLPELLKVKPLDLTKIRGCCYVGAQVS